MKCGISYFSVTITIFQDYIKLPPLKNKKENTPTVRKKQIEQRYCTSKLEEAFVCFHVCFFWSLTVLSPISHRQEIEGANKLN